MRFSIYSEMQLWPGKSPERLYAEVEEQIVHADRLGYDAYAIVEHFFFPRFSISPDPLALFAQVAPRTQRIRFRTMLHVLPFHNPTVLASRIAAAADPHRRALRVRRRARPRLGAAEGRRPHRGRARALRRVLRGLLQGARERALLARGPLLRGRTTRTWRPRRRRRRRASSSAARATRPTSSPGRRGWAVAVPPLLPYEALRGQLDIYRAELRRARQRARHRLDPRLLHGRGPRGRASATPSWRCGASSRATPRR